MTRAHLTSALLFLTFISSSIPTRAHDDMSKPEIKVETKQDQEGKEFVYMYIDGIKVHEKDPEKQPQPKVVTPAKSVGGAPSDAIVLFDGSEKSFKENWLGPKGEISQWKLIDGALEVTPKTGYLYSKKQFGSCQLHIEWLIPTSITRSGQGAGNSGVFLMDRYEIQILNNYKNTTYPDGQSGALYGRSKPLVNACRKPGEWQSYDIIFHRPKFNAQGKVIKRATFTVLHNGVLVQDHTILSGGTGWNGPHAATEYTAHPDRLPIKLQDHGHPVRFRNIWVRELKN